MFGIKGAYASKRMLAKLESVLDRQSQINSLEALYFAAVNKNKARPLVETVAIGIDANVFLKLVGHKKGPDIADYLRTEFAGPLIVPGQAVQEFWNNRLSAIDTQATLLKKKFIEFKKEAEKLTVDPELGTYVSDMEDTLARFDSDFGYLYDSSTLRSTLTLIEGLKDKAILSYVPRLKFYGIARHRKNTKTPPGFRDEADNDGDFYIWADFLYGLLLAKAKGKKFSHAVIVTQDKKPDWSREGVAHPILSAEVQKLVNVPFDVWTIEELHHAIFPQSPSGKTSKLAEVSTSDEPSTSSEAGNG